MDDWSYSVSRNSTVINENDFSTDPDVFQVETSQRITFKGAINHVQVSNNLLVASSRNCILRKVLGGKSDSRPIDRIEITPDEEDLVYSIFLDPLGRHILISIQSQKDNNYYLHCKANSVKQLLKLSGQIESVAWTSGAPGGGRSNSSEMVGAGSGGMTGSLVRDNDTGPILLGMDTGVIIEAHISATEGLKYYRQLFHVPKFSITGMLLQEIPSETSDKSRNGGGGNQKNSHYYLLFTTAGRLYQRVGEMSSSVPVFQNLFPNMDDSKSSAFSAGFKFMEFPRDFGYSFLRFHPTSGESMPTTLAWGTGPGIYFCHLDICSSSAMNNKVLGNNSLISYPVGEHEQTGSLMGVQLTQFHILVAYMDRIKAINAINEKVVFSHVIKLNNRERVMGLVRDPMTGLVYLHTDFTVYPFTLANEGRNAWRLYLDVQRYDLARQYCSNPDELDVVLARQADTLIASKKFVEAAEMYAETSISFEEIALKFVHLDDTSSLKTYLLKKIRLVNDILRVKPLTQVEDKSGTFHRLPVLVMWLMELFLASIANLDQAQLQSNSQISSLREEFRKFMMLPCVLDCLKLQPNLVYNLMDSHANTKDKLYFATLMQDYDRIVEHHINEKNYKEALEAIAQQRGTNLYYEYANVLVRNLPSKTISAWIKKGSALKPKKLVPALLEADPMESNRYLQYSVNILQCRDEEVHNLLIFVYATNSREGSKTVWENKLLSYFALYESAPDFMNNAYTTSTDLVAMMDLHFDPQYALRVCAEYGLVKASVRLHTMFKMHREAVNDALSKDDVALAKEIAKNSMIDRESQKQLWLHIAEHIVQKKGVDIREATQLMRECELIKLEDILPLFPNFDTIDDFKEAICESLDRYNDEIEKMKSNMHDAKISANHIRHQIQQYRHRYVVVEPQHECAICKYSLLLRTFYLFPCGHYFHTDCLANIVKPFMSGENRKRFADLLGEYTSGSTPQGLRQEFDDLIASDCYYCGDIAIHLVKEPLFELDTYRKELNSWD